MISTTMLVNNEKVHIKEVYSSAGDYVLRIMPKTDICLKLPNEDINLKANITTAFPAKAGIARAELIKEGKFALVG